MASYNPQPLNESSPQVLDSILGGLQTRVTPANSDADGLTHKLPDGATAGLLSRHRLAKMQSIPLKLQDGISSDPHEPNLIWKVSALQCQTSKSCPTFEADTSTTGYLAVHLIEMSQLSKTRLILSVSTVSTFHPPTCRS